MIDRSPSRLHPCLRPKTIGVAALVSTVAFLALPFGALICVVAGGFAYVVCTLVMLLLGLVGGLLLIVGGIAVAVGLCGGRSEATGGGVVAGGIGLAGLALHDHCSRPVYAAGEAALAQCSQTAEFLAKELFLGYGVCFWSWSILAIIAILALGVLATIGIFRCEAFTKTRLLGIHYTCPACHERGIPQFRCPGCSTLASDLAPSRYGVFHAHCASCRAELPTLDLFGRLTLQKVCRNSHCSADLAHPALGKQRELHLGIVGAQSSGKTTWMVASLWQLAQQFAPRNGFQVEFASDQQKKTLYDFVTGLASGARLGKTASTDRPRAFNVAIHPANGAGCLLYLYDAAGEDLKDEARMTGHRFHRFVDGLILVINPFAEALARPGKGGVTDRKAWSEINPAATDVASVIQPFMSRLEQQMNIPAEGQFPIPIAVVLTKMGALAKATWFGKAQKPDSAAGVNRSRQELRKSATIDKKPSSQIRDFLLHLGLANLVLGLETRFRNIGYFTTSAIEEIPAANRSPVPPRAERPLLWLLQQTGAFPAVTPADDGTTT